MMSGLLRRGGGALLLAATALMLGGVAPAVGDVAPDFRLTMVDGSHVQLSELRGQVIVLNFWATWCAPCRQELPTLDGYYRARRNSGLRVFAIATEGSLPVYQLRRLFGAMTIPSARAIRGPYGSLGGMPTNFVIDRAGRVRYAAAGAFTLASLNRTLIPLLNEPAP